MGNNFKTLKETISRIIFESTSTEDKELNKICKKALNEIKSSPILRTMYVVYDNIERNKFSNRDTAEIFLNENLFSFGSFSKKDIINENNKIHNILQEYIKESQEDKLFELIMESTKDRKLSRLNIKTELLEEVTNYLTNGVENSHVDEEVTISENITPEIVKRAIEILNEKYSFLDPIEKDIARAYMTEDHEAKEEIFNKLINENLNYLRKNLFEADEEDVELIGLLEDAHNEIKSMEFDKDIKVETYVKLINFKK